jgi:hypothetical protein
VSYVEQVVRAGQLHLRAVSRASALKLYTLGAGQSHLSKWESGEDYTDREHKLMFYIFLKSDNNPIMFNVASKCRLIEPGRHNNGSVLRGKS